MGEFDTRSGGKVGGGDRESSPIREPEKSTLTRRGLLVARVPQYAAVVPGVRMWSDAEAAHQRLLLARREAL